MSARPDGREWPGPSRAGSVGPGGGRGQVGGELLGFGEGGAGEDLR